MANEDIGQTIRMFFRGLFGSRLNAHLEEELLRARMDFERQLLDKERVVSDLREEVTQLRGKVDRYEMVLLPLVHQPKKDKTFQTLIGGPENLSWPEYKEYWDKQQEQELTDGVSNQGRAEEKQQIPG